MPLHQGKDKDGYYYIWGEHNKKYYYNPKNSKSESEAKEKALRQMRAIKASQYYRSLQGK